MRAPRTFLGYELLEEFQTGSMAESFRARHLASGNVVFLKRVHLESIRHKHALEREMQIYEKIREVHNPHVLEVLDLPRDEQYAAIVTEWADGGDLECFLRQNGPGGLPHAQVKPLAIELAEALGQLHSRLIVHRDLKPSNVLSANGKLKLADFGIAKNNAKPMTKRSFKRFGTRDYAAPEQFAGLEAHPSADVFSYGKIIAFLLTGQADATRVSGAEWKKLILSCVQVDPNLRPTIDIVLTEVTNLPT